MKIRQEQERQRDDAVIVGGDTSFNDLPLPSIPYVRVLYGFTRGTCIAYTYLSINADRL